MNIPMTQELLEAIEAKLNTQTPHGQRRCACGANHWGIHHKLILLVTDIPQMTFSPAASVTCAACGKIDLYSIEALGLQNLAQAMQ